MSASTSAALDWPGTRPRPAKLAQPAAMSASAKPRMRFTGLLALAGLRVEVLLELAGDFLPGVGVGRRRPLAGDVRPFHREIGIEREPLLRLAVRIGQDGLRRALGLAYAAVDALVGMNDEHVVAFVEAVHGADLDAVHVLALDAVFGDDVSHWRCLNLGGANYRTSLVGNS